MTVPPLNRRQTILRSSNAVGSHVLSTCGVPGMVGGTANRGVDLRASTMRIVGLETTMKNMLHCNTVGHLLHKAPYRDQNLL